MTARRPAIVASAAAVVLGAGVSGCGVPADSRARPVASIEIPVGLSPGDPGPTTTVVDTSAVIVWFVREAALVRSVHDVPSPAEPDRALAELLAGPTEEDQRAQLRSAIADPAAVVGVRVVGGIGAVDLAPSFAEIPANDQILAVAQIVLTLTDLRGVGRVRFIVDDTPVAVPLPNGDTTSDSVSRDEYLELVG